MKLERFNAWLSFTGNVAILLGLVALAIEIRGNTAAVRAQELGALWEQAQARQLASMDADFGELYVKSLYSPRELSLPEMVRLVPYIGHWVGNLARLYQAHEDGIVRESDWNTELLQAPIFLGSGFGLSVWEELKGDFPDQPEFVRAVDEAISNSPVVPDDDWYISLQARLRSAAE